VIGAEPFCEALALYLLAGLACAVAVSASGRGQDRGDLVMLVLLWPLYGPFVLALGGSGHRLRAERDLRRALRRMAGTPFARLLPDRTALRALSRSVRAAAARVREIDAVIATVQARSGNPALAQLQAARARFAGHLDEVDALLARLLTQVEVLRLGGVADVPGEELVGELVTRVEALGEMLEDGQRPAALGAGS
jgi:hypothetical protein